MRLLLLLLACSTLTAERIGLCIVATGRYDQFVAPLVASARKYFCPGHDVTYFIFTDGKIPEAPDIVRIEQKRLGWPYDTMMRFEIYASHAQTLANMDYLFATDADMRFMSRVTRILSPLVGTRHPGYVRKRGSYENNRRSLAYVRKREGKHYYAGGFWGGRSDRFLSLCYELSQRIRTDQQRGITAVWHDESHLNRYFIDNPPTKSLSPSYCYAESMRLPYKKRLVALDKNHSKLRNP